MSRPHRRPRRPPLSGEAKRERGYCGLFLSGRPAESLAHTHSGAVWLIALAKLVFHLASSARGYGFFGDELYYLTCAEHLDWGYVAPPLSIWMLHASQVFFGDSLAALRVLPALIGAACVVFAGVLAREPALGPTRYCTEFWVIGHGNFTASVRRAPLRLGVGCALSQWRR